MVLVISSAAARRLSKLSSAAARSSFAWLKAASVAAARCSACEAVCGEVMEVVFEAAPEDVFEAEVEVGEAALAGAEVVLGDAAPFALVVSTFTPFAPLAPLVP